MSFESLKEVRWHPRLLMEPSFTLAPSPIDDILQWMQQKNVGTIFPQAKVPDDPRRGLLMAS